MKKCNNRLKQTCGTRNYAICIDYESELPDFSELEDCVNLEETTEELYSLIGEIREQIDLSELGEECLNYVLDENDKIIVKNVLLKMEQEICILKQKVTNLENRQLCDIPITDCITDFDCLELPCDNTIITLADWMQAVQTKICTP